MSSEIEFWVIVLGAIFVGGLVMRMLSLLRNRKKARKMMKLYSAKTSVLSKAEGKFYASLAKVVGEKYLIFMKVGLSDIFGIGDGSGNQTAFDKISQKHVDFLLCEPDSFEPVLGIDLDDSANNRKARKNRDDFVKGIYSQTGLDLLRIPVSTQYPAEELRDQIGMILRESGRL